jgi:hypothetical protein
VVDIYYHIVAGLLQIVKLGCWDERANDNWITETGTNIIDAMDHALPERAKRKSNSKY